MEAKSEQGSSPAGQGKVQAGFLGFLDGLLRRREEYFEDVFESRHVVKLAGLLLLAIVVLSGFYGLMMGLKSGWQFMLASAVKVPVLYLLTLVICYPVLYVVNVLMGSRLGFLQTLALILMALALNSILLASCAPVVVFFIITGTDYHFLKLLHVLIFAFSGFWGMLALWRGLLAMCEKSNLYPPQAVRILLVWMLVFGFVGTQMAWSLRPFVGAPDLPFQIFREDQPGNFYTTVLDSTANIFRGRKAEPSGSDASR